MTQLLKMILNESRMSHDGSHGLKQLTKLMKLQSVMSAKEAIFSL